MSFLSDFAGGLMVNVGNQMQQNQEEERQLRLREAMEGRRQRYQQLAREQERQQGRADWIEQQNLMAQPRPGYDQSGRPGLMVDDYSLGEDGRMSRNSRRIADVPRTAKGTREQKEGNNLVTYRTYSDGSEERIATAPRNLGGRGDNRRRTQVVDVPGKGQVLIDLDTGEEIRVVGASKADLEKGENVDDIRREWARASTAVDESKGDALRSVAGQYGLDQRGLPTDDASLRQATLANIDAEYGRRLERAQSRGRGGGSATRPAGGERQGVKPADNAPYRDGEVLTGPGGKRYVVRNGRPVPL